MKSILFDSYAILSFYQDEKGAGTVEELLRSSKKGELPACMSEINLGEVHYWTIRRVGLENARKRLEQFFELPIRVIAPSTELILAAAELKAEYALSYADCFAAATAMKSSSAIVTGDPEFKKIAHLVEIVWI